MALKVAYKVDQSLLDDLDRLPTHLRTEVMPKALSEAARVINRSFQKHLPDGDVGPERGWNSKLPSMTDLGTRHLQLEDAKRVFKYKMKSEIRTKTKSYAKVDVKIVGVADRVGQTHFDLGEKGTKGVGRRHIFWGKGRDKNVLRRQKVDVAEVVRVETQSQVRAIIERHVVQAIKEQFG